MTEIEQPEVIDDEGNLQPHGFSGIDIELTFADADDTPQDVSTAELFFVVKDKLRIPLQPGSSNSKRRLVVTQDQIESLGVPPEDGPYRPFVVVNETGDVPDVRWEGFIKPRVFVKSSVN